MDLTERILKATRIGETIDWEFKSAKGGIPQSFWRTYSGMANSEGGVVVLGVAERDGQARLDGLDREQIAQHQKALWDALGSRQKVSINLLEPGDVEVAKIEGAELLLITIPRATRTQRPVYLGGNPLNNTWRRRHEGNYRCTDAEVRRMLADADEWPRDQRVLEHFGLEDLDADSLEHYRQRLRSVRPDHPWADLPPREFLQKLGGWRRDRSRRVEGLTLAGLLMFGKDQAIRDPDAAPHYFVDYREKLDPAVRWTDRVYPDGTWEANLFKFYARVWPKLVAGLPTPFRLEDTQRRDETATHQALREALVNALIHADYTGGGGIVVERYPDRFVIENPGTLLVSIEQYWSGGVSECRNPALQQMFLLIGFGERAGSGVDKIHSGWRAQHWRTPRLDIRGDPDRVNLTLPMVSLVPDETVAELRSRFGTVMGTLIPAEIQALATAHIEGTVSNVRLQELLSDHSADITRMLVGLCDRGLLVSDKRRRWTTYRLPSETEMVPPLFAEDSPHLASESTHSSAKVMASESSEEVTLRSIAEPVAHARRVPQEKMRSVLLLLCSGRYLTAEQLGGLVRRNVAHLRERYLTPMVREGLIELRYPEATNRPDQAYTARV